MSENQLIDNQWVEIVTPQAPADQTILIVIFICIFMLVALVAGYFLFRRSAKRKALSKLKKLQEKIRNRAQNRRELAFEVADSLRMGFQVTNLDKITMEADKKQQWELYRQCLLESCYASVSPDWEDIQALVNSAMSWIEYVPARKRGLNYA